MPAFELRRRPFERAVRTAARSIHPEPFRFREVAVDELQRAAEAHLSKLLHESRRLTTHAGRKTVFPKDVALAAKRCSD